MKQFLIVFGILTTSNAFSQCADTSNIYTFMYNGTTYEVIRENKSWTDAATCAVERGGKLAEINDQAEQDAVYNEVLNNAGINASNTVAPDGGNASYLWIGGNDLGTEGTWIWDGANTGSGAQFWQGTSSGNPVGGLYNNWGNEPDDWNGQDGLGLAITNWPLGTSGQWNDVDDGNTLYFIVELSGNVGVLETEQDAQLSVYPNPFDAMISLDVDVNSIETIVVSDGKGSIAKEFTPEIILQSNQMDLSDLVPGAYYLTVTFDNGNKQVTTLVK